MIIRLVKTFHRSYGRRNSLARQRFCERMARMRSAKERKRIERASSEPPRVEWRGRLELTVTFHNRLTGVIHTLDLRRGNRRDQYDAEVDGRPWEKGISATELSRFFRKKTAIHIGHET